MEYELTIFKPGIVEFNKKGEPIAEQPTIEKFKARSHSEARVTAAVKYKATGLGTKGHYNVSVAS